MELAHIVFYDFTESEKKRKYFLFFFFYYGCYDETKHLYICLSICYLHMGPKLFGTYTKLCQRKAAILNRIDIESLFKCNEEKAEIPSNHSISHHVPKLIFAFSL